MSGGWVSSDAPDPARVRQLPDRLVGIAYGRPASSPDSVHGLAQAAYRRPVGWVGSAFMAAECRCGVVAIGRCSSCGNAFCLTHQGRTVNNVAYVDQCAFVGPKPMRPSRHNGRNLRRGGRISAGDVPIMKPGSAGPAKALLASLAPAIVKRSHVYTTTPSGSVTSGVTGQASGVEVPLVTSRARAR